MRDIPDVEKAKNSLTQNQTQTAVSSLPTGYMKGFILQSRSNQLVVGAGIGNIRGRKVSQKTEYIISGDDFVAQTAIVPGLFYNVYVDFNLNYKVDSVDPISDSQDFAYYHPTLYNHRYIGQFFMGAGNVYQQIISYNPIEYNSLNTTKVDSLLLAVKEYLRVGYRGTGTPDNPAEGDSFMYIDGDEIRMVERIGDAWKSLLIIGGLLGTVFSAMIGCSGIYHPDSPPDSAEFFPKENFYYFQFENSYLNYDGTTFWDTTLTSFSSSIKKLGTYSLYNPFLFSEASWYTFGNDFSTGAWVYFADSDSLIWLGVTYGSIVDQISVIVDNSFPASIDVDVFKNSSHIIDTSISIPVKTGEWFYLSVIYDDSGDLLTITINSDTYEIDTSSGSWSGATSTLFFVNASSSDTYLDDLILAQDLADPELFIRHGNRGIAWNTTQVGSYLDQYISCAPGGRINFDDNQSEKSVGTFRFLEDADIPSDWVLNGGTATSFTEIDFSSYVPEGVRALLLAVQISATTTNYGMRVTLRKKGSSLTSTTQLPSLYAYDNAASSTRQLRKDILVNCDQYGKVEYICEANTTAYINILGYWR